MWQPIRAFLLTGLAGMALLTACEPPEPQTRLEFVAGTGLTSGSRAVTAGEIITTSLYARTPETSNKLKRFVVSRVYDTTLNESVTFLDTLLDSPEFGLTLMFGSRSTNNTQAQGREYWRFTLTDDQGRQYEKRYTLVNSFPDFNQPIHSFSSYYYHRNARENIRYLSTGQGLAFPGYVQHHPAIQPHLDFYFAEGPKLALNLRGLNNTRFKATNLTPTDFAAATAANQLTAHYDNAGAETSEPPALRPNDIIAFKTGKGKEGLIQVGTFEIVRDSLKQESFLRRVPFSVKVRK